jgi:hypothetical protein
MYFMWNQWKSIGRWSIVIQELIIVEGKKEIYVKNVILNIY